MVIGLRKRPAFLHELALAFDQLVADVQNGLLPLLQALDQEFSRPDFFPDVLAHSAGEAGRAIKSL
jgi:hypothetical protein